MKITLKTLNPSDADLFPEALELLNRTQGRNIFADDYLSNLIDDPNALIVAAFLDQQLVGMGVAQIIADFTFYLPFDENICLELGNKKVASFSTLAIVESLQGKGIGKKISQMRLDWVKKNNCHVVVGVSWASGLKHTSNRVFEKMGFKAGKRIENFFVEISLKKPFDCPGCQAAPCVCPAIFYRLDLS